MGSVAADLRNIAGTDLIRRFTLVNGTLAVETHPGVWAGKTWVFRDALEPAGAASA